MQCVTLVPYFSLLAIRGPLFLHTYLHAYTHAYKHTYILHIPTCLPDCLHPYIHTYITTYLHTYIHTYIHTVADSHTDIRTHMNKMSSSHTLISRVCAIPELLAHYPLRMSQFPSASRAVRKFVPISSRASDLRIWREAPVQAQQTPSSHSTHRPV